MFEEGFYTLNTAMLFGINTPNHWGSINNLLSSFCVLNTKLTDCNHQCYDFRKGAVSPYKIQIYEKHCCLHSMRYSSTTNILHSNIQN